MEFPSITLPDVDFDSAICLPTPSPPGPNASAALGKPKRKRAAPNTVLASVPPDSDPSQLSKAERKKLRAQTRGAECANCAVRTSPLWRTNTLGDGVLCNACGLYLKHNLRHRIVDKSSGSGPKRCVRSKIRAAEESLPLQALLRTAVEPQHPPATQHAEADPYPQPSQLVQTNVEIPEHDTNTEIQRMIDDTAATAAAAATAATVASEPLPTYFGDRPGSSSNVQIIDQEEFEVYRFYQLWCLQNQLIAGTGAGVFGSAVGHGGNWQRVYGADSGAGEAVEVGNMLSFEELLWTGSLGMGS